METLYFLCVILLPFSRPGGKDGGFTYIDVDASLFNFIQKDHSLVHVKWFIENYI